VREGETKEKKRVKATSSQPSTPHKENEETRSKCMFVLCCFVLKLIFLSVCLFVCLFVCLLVKVDAEEHLSVDSRKKRQRLSTARRHAKEDKKRDKTLPLISESTESTSTPPKRSPSAEELKQRRRFIQLTDLMALFLKERKSLFTVHFKTLLFSSFLSFIIQKTFSRFVKF
jgi:hypothetical protein